MFTCRQAQLLRAYIVSHWVQLLLLLLACAHVEKLYPNRCTGNDASYQTRCEKDAYASTHREAKSFWEWATGNGIYLFVFYYLFFILACYVRHSVRKVWRPSGAKTDLLYKGVLYTVSVVIFIKIYCDNNNNNNRPLSLSFKVRKNTSKIRALTLAIVERTIKMLSQNNSNDVCVREKVCHWLWLVLDMGVELTPLVPAKG